MSPLVLGPSLLVTTILAGLVLSSGPKRADNRAFFAHSIFGVFYAIVGAELNFGDPAHPPFLDAVQSAFGALWLFSTALFAYAFPSARRPPARLWLPLLALATYAIVARFTSPPWVTTQAYRVFGLVTLLVTFASLAGARGRARHEEALGGIRLVQWVLVFRALLGVTIFIARHTFGAAESTALAVVELVVAPPLTAVVFAWALLRYQLLDIRGFITRSIGLFAVTAFSGTLVVGAIEILQRLFRALNLVPWGEGQILAPGLVILILLAYNPLKMRLEERLEGWVNRGLQRAREAVETYTRRTDGSLDAALLLGALADAVGEILPGATAAVVVRRPSPRLLPARGFRLPGEAPLGEDARGPASPPSSPLARARPCPGGPEAARILHDRGERWWTRLDGGDEPALIPLTSLNADVILPFQAGDHGDGALLVRARSFEVERLELLHQLALRVGLQLDNALLYQGAIDANAALTEANNALADARLFLEAVVASIPVGLAVLGVGGQLRRWNPAMERISGVPAAVALAGTGLPEALSGVGSVEELGQVPGAVHRRTLSLPERRVVRVNARVAPLTTHDGTADGWVLLLSDVTELLRLQEDLEASRRLAALGQLAAAMAHEIRTPLTSIKLNAQILASKVDLPPEDAEHFDIVLEELERLNRYVSEVLDYARPMKLALEEQDLGELVEEVHRSLLFLLAERGVEVEVKVGSPPPLAWVDGERLKQVLINLIDNASQATGGEEGRIVVTAEALPGDEGFEIAVADDGQGMDEETLAHIFEPFFTTRPTGTGLGLAISSRIVESHGGQLRAESAPGAGATFRITLPARRP